MSKDFFAHKAGEYEQNKNRVDNVSNIAKALLDAVPLNADMEIMDFGSGTGLLLERIAPHVKKITAVDISQAMNKQLEAKRQQLDCELDMVEMDLEHSMMERQFDGIISSMTLHHIRDTEGMFKKFYQLLKPGGFIALADLDLEDGSFHEEDTGVHHSGFERDHVASIAEEAGFERVKVSSASVVHKASGDYPVFLLTAIRKG